MVTSCARFGHQAAVLRPHRARDAEHLLGDRHLEIHARLQQRRAVQRDVAVLDVAAILAQMQRDAVGAGLSASERRVHRIGIARAPRLAQRRHVIDVDAECDRR